VEEANVCLGRDGSLGSVVECKRHAQCVNEDAHGRVYIPFFD